MNHKAQFVEKKLSSRKVFDGKVFRVTVDEAEVAGGGTGLREVVHHNGGACILAIDDAWNIALVHQYRYALGRELIELPAGKLEPNEPPMEAAVRELSEEVGVTADEWQSFGSVIPTCGYSSEVIHIFLARGLTHTGQHLDKDEDLSVFWLPLEEAAQLVMDGSITDSKTVSGILRLYMQQKDTLRRGGAG